MSNQPKSVTIHATNGNGWATRINGDHASVTLYFMTNTFNIGRTEDEMTTVHRINFGNGITVARCPNPQCFEAHINEKMTRGSLNHICQFLNQLD